MINKSLTNIQDKFDGMIEEIASNTIGLLQRDRQKKHGKGTEYARADCSQIEWF